MTERELLAFEPAPAPLLILPAPAALSPSERQDWFMRAEQYVKSGREMIANYRRVADNPATNAAQRTALESTIRQYRAKIAVYNDYAAAIRQYEGS